MEMLYSIQIYFNTKVNTRAGMDPAYYPDIHSQQWSGTRIIALKIHDLFALKYTVLPHIFAVINCISVYTSSIGVFTDRSALYKPKKLVKRSKTLINWQFRFHVFGFCACTNIKRVPGYKETDPDIQFVDNYPDNRVVYNISLCSVCTYLK